MARTLARLKPKQVAHAKPKSGRPTILLADGGGLYLRASTGSDGSVNRSWTFRFELDRQRHELGLGPVYTVGLAQARDKARALRQQLLDGIDPLEARQQAERARLAEKAQGITFRQCARMYIALHEDGWKNPKHRAQWNSTLATYAFPLIGDLLVRDIDSAAVMKVIEPLWGTKTETAARLRGRIESILDYATASGFRSGDNPARHVVVALPKRSKVQKVKHHAALSYSELPDFMAELRQRESLSARALEFTILTAARTGETIGATWAEFDLKAATWSVPPERMKSGKPHVVPLPARAVDILRGLARRGNEPFKLSNMAMLQLLRAMRPGRTTHGFRSAFKDWANDQTSFANHIVEAALAHVVGNKVEAAYRRSDALEKRRRLMQAWASFCARPVPAGAAVTPLRRA